jgi:hypothetical protein
MRTPLATLLGPGTPSSNDGKPLFKRKARPKRKPKTLSKKERKRRQRDRVFNLKRK